MSKNFSSQEMVRSALMVALGVVLALGGYFFPLGGIFLMVAAVPLSVLCVMHSISLAVIAAVATALLVTLLAGPLLGVSYAVQIAPLGIVVGGCLQKRMRASTVVSAGIVTAIAGTVAAMLISLVITGVPMQDLAVTLNEMKQEMLRTMQDSGALDALVQNGYTQAQAMELFTRSYELILKIIPATLALGAMVKAMVHYGVCAYVLKRMGKKVRKLPRFERWALKTWHIFVIIGAWVLFLLSASLPQWISLIAENILAVYAAVLTVVGIAVGAHKIHFRKQSGGIKVMCVLMLGFGLMSGFILVFALVGLFDMLFDFRKLAQEKEEARRKYEEKKRRLEEQSAQESESADVSENDDSKEE